MRGGLVWKGGGWLLGSTPKTQPGLPRGLTVVSGEGCAWDAPAQCPAPWPDPSTQATGIFLGSEQWGGLPQMAKDGSGARSPRGSPMVGTQEEPNDGRVFVVLCC